MNKLEPNIFHKLYRKTQKFVSIHPVPSLVISILLVCGMASIFYCANIGWNLSNTSADWANFGSYFGGVLSPIFTALGFIFILWQIRDNGKERRVDRLEHLAERLENEIKQILAKEFIDKDSNTYVVNRLISFQHDFNYEAIFLPNNYSIIKNNLVNLRNSFVALTLILLKMEKQKGVEAETTIFYYKVKYSNNVMFLTNYRTFYFANEIEKYDSSKKLSEMDRQRKQDLIDFFTNIEPMEP
jgi:hypothetical protein